MKLTVVDLVTAALMGALMFISRQVMAFLPNIHLVATLIVVCTVVYRAKALLSLMVFIGLEILFAGGVWWIPYLYLWPLLWGVTMLLPRQMSDKVAVPVYAAVAGLHGLAYGTLYAPFQAIMFHFDWKQTLTWIAVGFPWDVVHAVGNICLGSLLIVPLIKLLRHIRRVGERL